MAYNFQQNLTCEYFPCHEGVEKENFSCMFCYCPLYALKEDCGGNYEYLPSGIKSCENCTIPHQGVEGYNMIMKEIGKVIDLAKIEPKE